MDLREASELAYHLMGKFGLDDWSLGFHNRASALGTCHYSIKTIKLSRKHVAIQTRETIENTIRHEIAHALAGEGKGHGPEWRAMCRVTGANPKACASGVKMVEGRYQATCRGCGKVSHANRLGKHMRAGRYSCAPCSGGRFDPEYVMIYKDTRTGRVVTHA